MRTLRSLRLATGLVLALFVTVHFSNHALGIISVDAQEAMRQVVSPVWRSIPGTVLLYFALIVHPLLGLYALWRRETLRMPAANPSARSLRSSSRFCKTAVEEPVPTLPVAGGMAL